MFSISTPFSDTLPVPHRTIRTARIARPNQQYNLRQAKNQYVAHQVQITAFLWQHYPPDTILDRNRLRWIFIDMSQKPDKCKFSIIIPVLNEQEYIHSVLELVRAQGCDGAREMIVVDGDGEGGTIRAIQGRDVVCITSSPGRGRQMNAGAAVAHGEILIFLHADTKLPADALIKIGHVLENQEYVGGAFDLSIDSNRWILKYIAARARFRSRLNRIPYGDQAIFMRKSYFDKIGGFRDIPLMEDVDLMRRIKKDGRKIHILRDKVTTSARRWEKEGAVYTTLRNQVVVMLYYLGVSPHKLARLYKFGSNSQVSGEKQRSNVGKNTL